MNSKISVIMPSYNVENYISRSINSVINQTFGFENIELIIIDDCSTDNTKEIIKDFSSKYNNIIPIFLKKNNGAPGIPRNIGIKKASAEYIMFIDSDDYYYPNMCQTLFDVITKKDVDIVACEGEILFEDNLIKEYYSETVGDIFEIDYIKNFPDLLSLSISLGLWNKIYRKSIIWDNNICFLNDMRNDDIYFSVKTNLCAEGIILMPDYWGYAYCLRPEGESMSITFNKKHLIQNTKGLLNIFQLLHKENEDYSSTVNVMLLGWTKWFLFTNLKNESDCQKSLLKKVKPYYKGYNIFSRIYSVSFWFNIIINICFKIFGISEYLTILTSNLISNIKILKDNLDL